MRQAGHNINITSGISLNKRELYEEIFKGEEPNKPVVRRMEKINYREGIG